MSVLPGRGSLGLPGAMALTAAGAATGAAFLPGGPWWLPWFSCVPLFLVAPWKDAGGAFISGWIFGAAVWAAGTYWLAERMALFLQVPGFAGVALFVLVCLWHGLMFGLAALASSRLRRLLEERAGWPAAAALLCSVLPAMAALEEFFPVLFPVYFASAMAAHPPSLQVLEYTGPAGVTCLVLGFNISLALLLRAGAEAFRRKTVTAELRKGSLLAACALALALANEVYGRARLARPDLAPEGGLSTVLVQASVPLGSGRGGGEALAAYRGLTRRAAQEVSPGLVIWPESVYGGVAGYRAAGSSVAFTEKFRAALAGDIPGDFFMLMNSRAVPEGSSGPAFNAAYSVDGERRLLGLSAKRRLFPFGEYMPFGRLLPALYKFSPRTASGLRHGTGASPLPVPGGAIGALICYEDLYPALAAELARKGAGALVELSNEEGFGTGTALRQHLALSSLRAVETRRYFLRAANTGISAVVDPAGRVIASLAPGESGYLYFKLPLGGPLTFYSRYERLIRLAAPAMLLALFAAARPRRVNKGGGGGLAGRPG